MELNYLSFQSAHGTRTLSHHGVKGMKWGVRRSEKQLARRRGKSKREDEHEDYQNAHAKTKVNTLSTKELQARTSRLQLERQYDSLNANEVDAVRARRRKKIEQAVKDYIALAGTLAAIAKATATYKQYADKIIDKIGDRVVKDIKFGKLTD